MKLLVERLAMIEGITMEKKFHKNYARVIIKWGQTHFQPEIMTVADILAIEELVLYPIELKLLDEITGTYGLVCPKLKAQIADAREDAMEEAFRMRDEQEEENKQEEHEPMTIGDLIKRQIERSEGDAA